VREPSDPIRERDWRFLMAVGLAIVGVSVLAWTFWPSSRPRPAQTDTQPHPDAIALAAAIPDESDTRRLLEDSTAIMVFENALESGLESLDLRREERQRIARLATDRLRLFVVPSREAYVRHVESITGSSAMNDEQVESYLRQAAQFADAELDLDAVISRPRYIRGVLANPLDSGHSSFNRGHRPYTDIAEPEAEEADVVDVLVPIIVSDPRGTGERGKAYLILSLVRDPDHADWRPWRHSVYDPAELVDVLPAPWM